MVIVRACTTGRRRQNPIIRVPATFIGPYITEERQPEDFIILRTHLSIGGSHNKSEQCLLDFGDQGDRMSRIL